MKRNIARGVLAVSLFVNSGAAVQAQGSFVNLNFEHATIVVNPASPYYPDMVFASSAIPFWTAYTYEQQQTDILYDAIALSAAQVGIYDTNYPSLAPVQGRYSVVLAGEFSDNTTPHDSAAIAQTGRVPDTAESLTFWGQVGGLQVTFAGQVLPWVAIGSGPNYSIYGCDISAFAGQAGELRFTTLPNTSALLDNIQFSPDPIPEPGVLALSALGALVVAWRVRLRERQGRSHPS